MATNPISILKLNATGIAHEPVAVDGSETIPVNTIPLSTDAGQVLSIGTDAGLYAAAQAIATQENITAGTEGKAVDAAGLKTAGITSAAVATIAGKTGGELAENNGITIVGAQNLGGYSPEFKAKLSTSVYLFTSLRFYSTGSQNYAYLTVSQASAVSNIWMFQASTGVFYSPGGVQQSCDYRLKDDIKPISGALEKLSAVVGCTYIMAGQNRAGIVAQDLQTVLPQAVMVSPMEIDKDGVTISDILSVDSMGVIGLLVEAIKELKAEVNILKNM